MVLTISSSLIALIATQNAAHLSKVPFTNFFMMSGILSRTEWIDAPVGSSANADSTNILFAHRACPVICTPFGITITPMSFLASFSACSRERVCSTVGGTMTSFGHLVLNAASRRFQSTFTNPLSMLNHSSATELVAKLFSSCLALNASEDDSLNPLLISFRKFPGTGSSAQLLPQKKRAGAISLSESSEMCTGIGSGDVAGVDWLRDNWSKTEELLVHERVEGDDGMESSVSEMYPNCPLLGFLRASVRSERWFDRLLRELRDWCTEEKFSEGDKLLVEVVKKSGVLVTVLVNGVSVS